MCRKGGHESDPPTQSDPIFFTYKTLEWPYRTSAFAKHLAIEKIGVPKLFISLYIYLIFFYIANWKVPEEFS